VKLKGTKKHLNTFRHQKRKTNPWHTDDISQQDKPNKKAPKRRARRAKRKNHKILHFRCPTLNSEAEINNMSPDPTAKYKSHNQTIFQLQTNPTTKLYSQTSRFLL